MMGVSRGRWRLPGVGVLQRTHPVFFSRDGGLTSRIRAPRWSAVRGVCSAGFTTTVFPQQSAGASFHASIRSGKFHCNGAQRSVGAQQDAGFAWARFGASGVPRESGMVKTALPPALLKRVLGDADSYSRQR